MFCCCMSKEWSELLYVLMGIKNVAMCLKLKSLCTTDIDGELIGMFYPYLC